MTRHLYACLTLALVFPLAACNGIEGGEPDPDDQVGTVGEIDGRLGGYVFADLTGAFFQQGYTPEGQFVLRVWLDDYFGSCAEFQEFAADTAAYRGDPPGEAHGFIRLDLTTWDGDKFVGPASTGTYGVAPEEEPEIGAKVVFGYAFVATLDGNDANDFSYSTEGAAGTVQIETVDAQKVAGTLDLTVNEAYPGLATGLPLAGWFEATPCSL